MIEGWQARIDAAQRKTHKRIAGTRYSRRAYGTEYPGMEMRPRCWDCGVDKGQLHVEHCGVERCARCGIGQAAFCDCAATTPGMGGQSAEKVELLHDRT